TRAAAYLEKIDALGGMIRALERGYVQQEIQNAAYEYQQQVDRGEATVVGVNKLPLMKENQFPPSKPTRLSNPNRWSAYARCGPAAISNPGKPRSNQWKKQPARAQTSCHASFRPWKPALPLAKFLIRFGASSESTERRW